VDSLVADQLPPPPPVNNDYEYHPIPVTKPPIGHNYMMHLWHCPREVPEEEFFCKRFPKKAGPCRFSRDDSPTTNLGWGLHIVETLNISLIVWMVFGLTAFAGIAFGIAWTLLKDDISGAYTVVSYITSLLTLLLMAIMSNIAGI
jgi:hypothetical protein